MDIRLSHETNLEVTAALHMLLSPRMLQMLKVLNMSYPALLDRIQQESEENPLLDVEKRESMIDYLRAGEKISKSDLPYTEDEERSKLEDYIKKGTDIFEHLSSQLDLMEVPESKREIVDRLIRGLDGNGYIQDYEELKKSICTETECTPQTVDEALEVLQELEPDGIGARNAKECLLIQIRHYAFDSEQLEELLEQAVENYLDDIASGNTELLARALGISSEGAENLIKFIKENLNPYPGASFATTSSAAIPSFAVKEIEGRLQAVNLEQRFGPVIRINERYCKMLDDPKTDAETVKYIREKMEKARQLMEQVNKRHETIEKIVGIIIEWQSDFLTGKSRTPKPLTQKVISDRFGMHPSTTSRAIADKYIETPVGLIKIRSLCPREFSGNTKEGIKEIVRKIFASEDRKAPFTDEQVCSLLNERGIMVKRRTVSDYRSELGIPKVIDRKK